jgi:hypothetical protein
MPNFMRPDPAVTSQLPVVIGEAAYRTPHISDFGGFVLDEWLCVSNATDVE